MGEHPEEIKIAGQISRSLENMLSLKADFFGFIFEDKAIRQSVKNRMALLRYNRESLAALSIVRIAERIVKFWDKPVEKSAQLR